MEGRFSVACFDVAGALGALACTAFAAGVTVWDSDPGTDRVRAMAVTSAPSFRAALPRVEVRPDAEAEAVME